jgi:hypothetical protein
MNKLTVSQFTDTSTGELVTFKELAGGKYVEICVKQVNVAKSSGAGIGFVTKRKSNRTGFLKFDAETWADINASIKDGVDYNNVAPKFDLEPLKIVHQSSFDMFDEYSKARQAYVRDDAGEYVLDADGKKTLTDALRDGKKYYQRSIFADNANAKDVWGDVDTEGNFTVSNTPESNLAETPAKVSAEAEV